MGVVEKCDRLRRLLDTRCPGVDIDDDDIYKLVVSGFTTEYVIAGASKDDLVEVLPGRLGVVIGLVKTFGEPQRSTADVPEKGKKSVGDFSGPIDSTEPEDESKHDPDITVEAVEALKEASDALKATDEVHSTNQDRPESCDRLLSTPLKRSLERVATPVPDSDVPQAAKRTRRNWTPRETEALIIRKLQPSLPKGNAGWEHISSQIPGRSSQQCRLRWDTLKKSCKKIKEYCDSHGQELSQVSKEEFQSMKLDIIFFSNGRWYKMIDDSYTRPTITSSGPAANELNGVSTSPHPVGKPNLPSSACPNLEVPRPELIPVEQGSAAVEPTGWRQHEEAGIFIDNYLVLIKTKKHQRCEEAQPMLLILWWLHLDQFLLHGELQQKVTQQQQQQQPGLKDRFHAWANRTSTAWLSKNLRRQSSQP